MKIVILIVISLIVFIQTDDNNKLLGKWRIIKSTNELDAICQNSKVAKFYINFLPNNKFEMGDGINADGSDLKRTGQFSLDRKAIHFLKVKSNEEYGTQNYSFEMPIIKISADTLVLKFNMCITSDTGDYKSGKLILCRKE